MKRTILAAGLSILFLGGCSRQIPQPYYETNTHYSFSSIEGQSFLDGDISSSSFAIRPCSFEEYYSCFTESESKGKWGLEWQNQTDYSVTFDLVVWEAGPFVSMPSFFFGSELETHKYDKKSWVTLHMAINEHHRDDADRLMIRMDFAIETHPEIRITVSPFNENPTDSNSFKVVMKMD